MENARISEAYLGYSDHVPVVRISCESPRIKSTVSTGDIHLKGMDFACFMETLMCVAGVREWSRLKGSYIRIETNAQGELVALSHIINEAYLCLSDFDGSITKESVD